MTSKLTSQIVCTPNPNKGEFEFGGFSVKAGCGKLRWNTTRQGDMWINGLFPEDEPLISNCSASAINLQSSSDSHTNEHSEVDWISKEIAYQELICNDRANHWSDVNPGRADLVKEEHDMDIISTLTAVAALLRDWCVLEADLSPPVIDECIDRSNSLDSDYHDEWIWFSDDKDEQSKVLCMQKDVPMQSDVLSRSHTDAAWDNFIQERVTRQQMLYRTFFHPGSPEKDENKNKFLLNVAHVQQDSFESQKYIDTCWFSEQWSNKEFISSKHSLSRTGQLHTVHMQSQLGEADDASNDEELNMIQHSLVDIGSHDQRALFGGQHPVASRYSFGREDYPLLGSAVSELLENHCMFGEGQIWAKANDDDNLIDFQGEEVHEKKFSSHAIQEQSVFSYGIAHEFEIDNEMDKEGKAIALVHEAMPFVLSHMCLQDLLTMEKVCKSFRNWIRNDVLLWQQLHVEPPLNKSLTDEVLLELASRAKGQLRCLNLVECTKVTEAAVEQVVLSNPMLTKLSLPGCTRISADSVVRMVEMHSYQGHPAVSGLKQLRVRNIYGITREHLAKLKDMVGARSAYQRKPQYYHNGHHASFCDDDRPIDVEECPKCTNVRLVYDCTREKCQQNQGLKFQDCRACFLCTVRCEECGRCINDNDFEETFALDLLCSCCWFRLPKCAACSRPGRGRHADHFIRTSERTFFCGDCSGTSSDARAPEFHVHA